ncbi:MAG: hypothetical protein HC814_02840, partial [Rhodobacteraceae bacterium]|nr:hypothetical protein [Paracoccaceae bacterium]
MDEAFDLCPFIDGDGPRARFQVTKDFTDDNPSEVEVTISCNTGLIIEQSQGVSEGNSIVFIVTEYDDGELDCEITEETPDGYTATYDASGGTEDENGCYFEDIAWGQFAACAITNEPDPIDVVITKDWVFEGTTDGEGIDLRYELTLFCDSEIVDGIEIGGGDNVESPVGFNGPGCGLIQKAAESAQGKLILLEWCKTFDGEGP